MTPSKNSSPILIGYDASSTVGERTGIGQSAAELLNAMADELPDGWKIRALVNSRPHPPPMADTWTRAPGIELRHTRHSGRLLLRGWQYLRFPPVESLLGQIDLYHSPASYVAPVRHARQIVTVHDLFFLEEGGDLDPYGGGYFRRTFPRGLPRCDRIIAISEYTKRRIIQAYATPPEKISVIYLGVNTEVYSSKPRADDAERTNRWAEGKPYLLCVSTIGPRRKNLEGLLAAYALARTEMADLPPLIIAGRTNNPEVEQRFLREIRRLGLESHLRSTGYVSREDLSALYRGALGLVVPSLDEGLGLTVLEAMACGCPVLASDRGALPETAGEATLLTSVDSPEALSKALVKFAGDEELRSRLRTAGIERVKRFSWKSAARSTLELYAHVLGRKH